MKQKIEIVPAKIIHLKKNGRYLLILPRIENPEELQIALNGAFPDVGILAIAVGNVSEVKIAELMETHE